MNRFSLLRFLLPAFALVLVLTRPFGGDAGAQTPVPTPSGPIVVTLTPAQVALSCAASTNVTVNVTQGGVAVPNGTQVTIAANPGTVAPAIVTTNNGTGAFTYFSPAAGGGTATISGTALSTGGQTQIQLFCGAGGGSGISIPGARINAPVVQCFGTTANVIFSWTPVAGADSQFVDLTLANNGFAPGTFIGFGPLGPTTTTIQWNGLVAGQQHYWRVSAGVPGIGWAFSQTGVFTPCGPTAPAGGTTYVCSGGGRAAVTFGIPTPPVGTSATYIDISLLDNGFLPGTFVGQNASGAQNFTWSGILANAQHVYRINNLTPAGWQTAMTSTFIAAC